MYRLSVCNNDNGWGGICDVGDKKVSVVAGRVMFRSDKIKDRDHYHNCNVSDEDKG